MPTSYGPHYCGGELLESEVAYVVERNGQRICLFVAGSVCDRCGREQILSDTVATIEGVMDGQIALRNVKHALVADTRVTLESAMCASTPDESYVNTQRTGFIVSHAGSR